MNPRKNEKANLRMPLPFLHTIPFLVFHMGTSPLYNL